MVLCAKKEGVKIADGADNLPGLYYWSWSKIHGCWRCINQHPSTADNDIRTKYTTFLHLVFCDFLSTYYFIRPHRLHAVHSAESGWGA